MNFFRHLQNNSKRKKHQKLKWSFKNLKFHYVDTLDFECLTIFIYRILEKNNVLLIVIKLWEAYHNCIVKNAYDYFIMNVWICRKMPTQHIYARQIKSCVNVLFIKKIQTWFCRTARVKKTFFRQANSAISQLVQKIVQLKKLRMLPFKRLLLQREENTLLFRALTLHVPRKNHLILYEMNIKQCKFY